MQVIAQGMRDLAQLMMIVMKNLDYPAIRQIYSSRTLSSHFLFFSSLNLIFPPNDIG
jgi:hypothetical protein